PDSYRDSTPQYFFLRYYLMNLFLCEDSNHCPPAGGYEPNKLLPIAIGTPPHNISFCAII
ncbi:MAG: hypothetical protein K9G47_01195, partial [Bacteroidales bacterium]|nr:hypothetical protein [Bacteroidales bacterium]